MATANETRNEDWLRTRTWDLPTTVEGLRQSGIDPQSLLTLPAAEAMPPELRAEIEGLATPVDQPPMNVPEHQKMAAMTAVEVARLADDGDPDAIAWLLAALDLADQGDPDAVAWFEYDPDAHPRDERGRFTDKGGADDSGGSVKGPGVPTTEAPFDAMVLPSRHELPPPSDPKARAAVVNQINDEAKRLKLDSESVWDKVDGKEGMWKAEREAMHHEIVKAVFDREVAEGALQNREAIMLGGLPGAGKTTSIEERIDTSQYIELSADDMKVEMANRGMIEPPVEGMGYLEAAPLVHEESSKLSKDLAAMATSQGYNIIWDMSMASPGSIESRIAQMDRSGGYHVTGMFVDVPVEQAVASAEYRYAKGLEEDKMFARMMPESVIRSQADPTRAFDSVNEANFESFKTNFHEFVKIDNEGWKREVVEVSSDRVFDLLKAP